MRYRLFFPFPDTLGRDMLDVLFSTEQPTDRTYRHVYTGEIDSAGDPDVEATISRLWRRHNIGDPGTVNRPRPQEIRSMCAGDILYLEDTGTAWFVANPLRALTGAERPWLEGVSDGPRPLLAAEAGAPEPYERTLDPATTARRERAVTLTETGPIPAIYVAPDDADLYGPLADSIQRDRWLDDILNAPDPDAALTRAQEQLVLAAATDDTVILRWCTACGRRYEGTRGAYCQNPYVNNGCDGHLGDPAAPSDPPRTRAARR